MAAISGTLACGQSHKPDVPQFEDFLVAEQWPGPNHRVRLISPAEKEFQTRLTSASKESPNFAGHYQFLIWACGSNCLMGAIVDLSTGVVYSPPGGVATRRDRWWMDIWPTSNDAVEFKPNSRLVVVRGHRPGTEFRDICYFEWRDRTFRLVRQVAVKERY